MTHTISLYDYSEVTEKNVIVSGQSTTYANHQLVSFPSIQEVKEQHAKLGKIAKEKGVTLNRKYKTLAKAKELVEAAELEFAEYEKTFSAYRDFWQSQIKDGCISYDDSNDFKVGYELSQRLREMFYANTVLSQYFDKARWIQNALQSAEDANDNSNMTIYI